MYYFCGFIGIFFNIGQVFNRPGVEGAVLQTASSFINYLSAGF